MTSLKDLYIPHPKSTRRGSKELGPLRECFHQGTHKSPIKLSALPASWSLGLLGLGDQQARERVTILAGIMGPDRWERQGCCYLRGQRRTHLALEWPVEASPGSFWPSPDSQSAWTAARASEGPGEQGSAPLGTRVSLPLPDKPPRWAEMLGKEGGPPSKDGRESREWLGQTLRSNPSPRAPRKNGLGFRSNCTAVCFPLCPALSRLLDQLLRNQETGPCGKLSPRSLETGLLIPKRYRPPQVTNLLLHRQDSETLFFLGGWSLNPRPALSAASEKLVPALVFTELSRAPRSTPIIKLLLWLMLSIQRLSRCYLSMVGLLSWNTDSIGKVIW